MECLWMITKLSDLVCSWEPGFGDDQQSSCFSRLSLTALSWCLSKSCHSVEDDVALMEQPTPLPVLGTVEADNLMILQTEKHQWQRRRESCVHILSNLGDRSRKLDLKRQHNVWWTPDPDLLSISLWVETRRQADGSSQSVAKRLPNL